MDTSRLEQIILEEMDKDWCWYTLADGRRVQGQAISYLQRLLREWRGVRGLGCLADFESMVGRTAFSVVEARNSRNQRCRIVTL